MKAKIKVAILVCLLSCTICRGFVRASCKQQQGQTVGIPRIRDNSFQTHPTKYTKFFVDVVEDAERIEKLSPLDSVWDEFSDEAFQDVMTMIKRIEQESRGSINYEPIFQALAKSRNELAPDLADKLLHYVARQARTNDSLIPTAHIYNTVISIWSDSYRKDAGQRCCEYLETLWTLYAEKQDTKFLPHRSMYISTIVALSRSRQREGAEKAEQLLKDMMMLQEQYPGLSPDTTCVNGVLNAWSKSGVLRGAATRCEQILNKMISDYEAGRTQLQPNTTSFNTVMDALAKSKEEEAEHRAEGWLQKMENLSSMDESLSMICKPDEVSFNTVLNCWAQSKSRNGANRATSILKHMEQRYHTKNTEIHPDAASYATVINAWSRSREANAVKRAEEVMKWAEDAQERSNSVKLDTLTYNSMINCYAKSNAPEAADRALDLLEMLKYKCFEEGDQRFHPDVVTYTSVIDALSKQATYTASKTAELLLDELEAAFKSSGDIRFRPNIRTYTSTVNAIGRSRKEPERAERILNRIGPNLEVRNSHVKPDVVFFNTLINAYGWSTQKEKAAKCYEFLNIMFDLYESNQNVDCKPDIVTANSVLNACAFEKANSEDERKAIMDIVVNTLEIFQSVAPLYGNPDHATYAHVLLAISNHMPMNQTRRKMAQSTFLQCCKSGQVSVMVLSNLMLALPWEQFAEILGPALQSKKGTTLRFDANKFPGWWIRFTKKSFSRGRRLQSSRPSRKRPNNGRSSSKKRH